MSRLPSAYQEVEYLQSSGTQYINTQFIPKHSTRVLMRAVVTDLSTHNALFGARSTTGLDGLSFTLLVLSDNTVRSDYYGTEVNVTTASVLRELSIDKNKNVCTVNGATGTNAASTSTSEYPLFLFAVNTAGTAMYPASAKISSCCIYDNGILVRDFVPCYRKSDNVAGLYDTAQGAFYTNSGTGTFAIGPEISEPVVVTGGFMPFAFALRRRLLQKAAGEKLCTVAVTGSFKGNYGNECVVRIGSETGENISAVGSYSLPQGTLLYLRAKRGNNASFSTPTITLDGVTVSTVSSGIATYNLVVTQDCTIACSISGSHYTANANIAITT